MSILFPLKMFAVFGLLFVLSPIEVKGLKCHVNGIGIFGPIGNISREALEEVGKSKNDDCSKAIDILLGTEVNCETTYGAQPDKALFWACAKLVVAGKESKGCMTAVGTGSGEGSTCVRGKSGEFCFCNDKDLCNGGLPLKTGFGLMSLPLVAIYKYLQ